MSRRRPAQAVPGRLQEHTNPPHHAGNALLRVAELRRTAFYSLGKRADAAATVDAGRGGCCGRCGHCSCLRTGGRRSTSASGAGLFDFQRGPQGQSRRSALPRCTQVLRCGVTLCCGSGSDAGGSSPRTTTEGGSRARCALIAARQHVRGGSDAEGSRIGRRRAHCPRHITPESSVPRAGSHTPASCHVTIISCACPPVHESQAVRRLTHGPHQPSSLTHLTSLSLPGQHKIPGMITRALN